MEYLRSHSKEARDGVKNWFISLLSKSEFGMSIFDRFVTRVSDEKSENIDYLLREGTVEQLVKEGRTPICLGTMGHARKGEPFQVSSFYQVPPEGFNPDTILNVYMSMGQFLFRFKDGSISFGSTYTLNDDQASLVEQRIESTKNKE